MSSGAILAQIGACESQIDAVKNEIAKLNIKIEMQDSAISSYAARKNDWQAETQEKTAKYNSTVAHQAKAVISFRFQTAVLERFNGDKAGIEGRICRIEEGMKKELSVNQELLERKETELRNLQTQLNSLQTQYQSALATEAAEQQAQLHSNSVK